MQILIWTMARALGDGIFFTGCYRRLNQIYPNIEIDIFCTSMHANALKNNPYIRNIYFFRHYTKPFQIVKQQKILQNYYIQKYFGDLKKAGKNKYDYILDVDTLFNKANIAMLYYLKQKTGAEIISNYKVEYDSNKKLSKELFDHITNGYAFEFFNIIPPLQPELYIDNNSLEKASLFLTPYKNDSNIKIVIVNGEGSGKKSINSEQIINIVNTLLKDKNIYVMFLGYKNVYHKYKDIIDKINSSRVLITYETTIDDTFAFIKQSNLVISVDTSIIHMATALYTPLIEICGYAEKDYNPVLPIAQGGGFKVIYKDKETLQIDLTELQIYVKELLYD